jgi:hypothetical protein
MRKALLLFLVLTIAFPLSAQQGSTITDTAYVNSVDAENTDQGVVLSVRGDLPDACTELGEVSQTVDTSGETITVTILIETNRSADVVCAQVLTGFETTVVLDTSELAAGTYTVNVNGVSTEVTVGTMECPQEAEGMSLYEAQGICFLYPEDYQEMSADGFILLSQADSDSLFLVEIKADESSLEAIAEGFDESSPANFGGQEFFLVEDSDAEMRQAYAVFEGNRYIFTMQPIDEGLWETIMTSLFFYAESE